MSELDVQIGGDHYKSMPIQPVEFCHKNGIGFLPGNVIKYVCRYKSKNGRQDLQKALHYLKLLIELEFGADPPPQKEVSIQPPKPEPRLHTSWCAIDPDHKGACRCSDGLTYYPAGQATALSPADLSGAQNSAAQRGHTPALNPPSPRGQPPVPGADAPSHDGVKRPL